MQIHPWLAAFRMALRPQLYVALAELSEPFMPRRPGKSHITTIDAPTFFHLPCGKSAIPVPQAIGAITKLQSHTCQALAPGQDDESTKTESTIWSVVACADRRLGFCIFSFGLGERRSTRTSRIGPRCPGKPYCDLQSTSERC